MAIQSKKWFILLCTCFFLSAPLNVCLASTTIKTIQNLIDSGVTKHNNNDAEGAILDYGRALLLDHHSDEIRRRLICLTKSFHLNSLQKIKIYAITDTSRNISQTYEKIDYLLDKKEFLLKQLAVKGRDRNKLEERCAYIENIFLRNRKPANYFNAETRKNVLSVNTIIAVLREDQQVASDSLLSLEHQIDMLRLAKGDVAFEQRPVIADQQKSARPVEIPRKQLVAYTKKQTGPIKKRKVIKINALNEYSDVGKSDRIDKQINAIETATYSDHTGRVIFESKSSGPSKRHIIKITEKALYPGQDESIRPTPPALNVTEQSTKNNDSTSPLDQEVGSLQKELQTVQKEIRNLKQQLAIKDERLAKLSGQIVDISLQLSEKDLELSKYVEDIKQMNQEFRDLKSRFDLGQKIISDKDTNLAKLQDEITAMESRIKEKQVNFDNSIKSKQFLINTKNEKINELNGMLSIYREQYHDAYYKTKNVDTSLRTLKESLFFAETKLQKKDQELETSKERLEFLSDELSKIKHEIQKLNDNRTYLQKLEDVRKIINSQQLSLLD